QPTPAAAQTLLDGFAGALFPRHYDPTSGLIRFPRSLGQLKWSLAPIEGGDLADPRIAFFARQNPSWSGRTELACVARMPCDLPLRYSIKALAKLGPRRARLAAPTPATTPGRRG